MVCNLHCLHLSTTTLLTHHRFLVHQPIPTELSMPIELGTSAEGICGLLPPLCLHRSTKVLHGGLFFCVQFSILRPFSSPRPISQSSLPKSDSVVSLFNILSPFLSPPFLLIYFHNSDVQALKDPVGPSVYLHPSPVAQLICSLCPVLFINSNFHAFAQGITFASSSSCSCHGTVTCACHPFLDRGMKCLHVAFSD